MLQIIVVVMLVAAVAIAVYVFRAPKKELVAVAAPSVQFDANDDADLAGVSWLHEAGAEFAGLNESARCDLIFAVAAIDDDRSRRLLVHALDDPSTTVALAAAHALARSGRIATVREYAQRHDGPRSDELVQLLSLLA